MAEPIYPKIEEGGEKPTMIGLEELAAETEAEMQPPRTRVESKDVRDSDKVGLLESVSTMGDYDISACVCGVYVCEY